LKIRFIIILLGLLIPVFSIAAKPAVCPTVTAIQRAGIDFVEDTTLGMMGFHLKDHYNTQDEWSFMIIGNLNVNDTEEARRIYNQRLGLLSLSKGPIPTKDDSREEWQCQYWYEEGGDEGTLLLGIAVTPPMEL